MLYFTDPKRYHAASASALTRLALLRAKTDRHSASQALTQAGFHLESAIAPTPENGFLAPHMGGWPI